MVWVLPAPRPILYVYKPRHPYDLTSVLADGVFFLLSCGLIFLCLLDSKYRCRVCLRRLRMPVESGNWSRAILFSPPRVTSICPYGHGTLDVPEVHVSGQNPAEWHAHGDIWRELEALDRPRK